MPTNPSENNALNGSKALQRAHGRCLDHFQRDLSDAERVLLDKVREGFVYELGKTCPNENTPEAEREKLTIRADFIRFLALGGDEQAPVHERGIWVKGAVIRGDLDFNGCEDVRPIALERCWINGRVILRDARTRTINLDYSLVSGSRVVGNEHNDSHMAIEAKRAKIDGSMYCRRGFIAHGEANFIEADIKGSLECHGGHFINPKGRALLCSRIKVAGSVFFNEAFKAEGEVRFQRAEISGDLLCDGGHFKNTVPGQQAVFFSRSKITGSVFMRDGALVEGIANFIDAEIGNSLECQGGHFHNPEGIALYCSRAKITGSVFFKEGFDACGEISLRNAQIGGHLVGSQGSFHCPGGKALSCEGMRVVGSCNFHQAVADGEMNFIDAEIGGSFEWHGSRLNNPDGVALYCSRTKIDGSALLYQGFQAVGEVSFRNAQVGGHLDGSTGSFTSHAPKRKALSCELARIVGSSYFHKASAEGEVNFIDCSIGGSFEWHGSHLNNPGGTALYCSRAKVKGSVFLHQGFTSDGEISFRSAEIGGTFDGSEGKFTNRGARALSCERVRVIGSVDLCESEASGEVNFIDAEVCSSFECKKAVFTNNGGRVLYCSRAKITGSVILYDGFRAEGEVVFRRAEIGGNLECDTATFFNPDAAALSCTRAKIAGNVRLGNGFLALGQVEFSNVDVGGFIGCAGGTFVNKKAIGSATYVAQKPDISICADALILRNAVINGSLWLGPAHNAPYDKEVKIEGSLDLRDAKVAVLVDSDKSWPDEDGGTDAAGNELLYVIYLDGFDYGRFAGQSRVDQKTRKAWLERQPPNDLKREFKAQPFEHLAQIYREMGDAAAARKITIFRERTRLRLRLPLTGRSWITSPANWGKWLLMETAIGYGHRWHRLFIAAVVIWAVFATAFMRFGASFEMKDIQNMSATQMEQCRTVGCTHDKKTISSFKPWIYSMDALLSAPQTLSEYVLLPAVNPKHEPFGFNQFNTWQPQNGVATYLVWLEYALGWILSLVALAGITGLIKKA